jgi:RNA polymerase sigma factor (sigma-70 family)
MEVVVGERGDGDDFDGVFRDLFTPAFRVAYRILGNVDDAEDAAAEALARALLKWRRVGALSYRDAWVMRVASNVAIDMARKRRRPPVTDGLVEDQADTTVLRVALTAALAALSSRQREVVSLRYVAGLSEAEVATSLGISVNSVKKHMARGTAGLRQRLGGEWKEVELVAD